MNFFGIPSVLFWLDPSLIQMLSPLADEIGHDLFRLLVAHQGSQGTEEDYQQMVTVFSDNFVDGFHKWGDAVSTAGWGRFEITEFDEKNQKAVVKVTNPWEILMQRKRNTNWGCPFHQGKIIGLFTHAFNTTCWAEERNASFDSDNSSVEFHVQPSNKTIETEISNLRIARQHEKERLLTEEVERKTKEMVALEDELFKAKQIEGLGIVAGGIAHDFNNFLTTVVSNVGVAKIEIGTDHKAYPFLDIAEAAGFQASDLTRQLLTFAKGGNPSKETASAEILVRSATTFGLHGSNVQTFFSFPTNLPDIDVDCGQVGQVIQNIVINADQAMPSGGELVIRGETLDTVDALDAEGPFVNITIEDSGVGMSKDVLSKIFEPYFTTKKSGHGLGLATSFMIIKRHGGLLTAESMVGRGTKFSIYLPVAKISSARKDSKSIDSAQATKGCRILIVDDIETIRISLKYILKSLGYRTHACDEGASGIHAYKEAQKKGDPFDLVILDLTIPGGMGGQEMLEKIKGFDPDIKAIVSSGYSDDPILSDYTKYGFKGTVPKPYRIDDLRKELERVLNG